MTERYRDQTVSPGPVWNLTYWPVSLTHQTYQAVSCLVLYCSEWYAYRSVLVPAYSFIIYSSLVLFFYCWYSPVCATSPTPPLICAITSRPLLHCRILFFHISPSVPIVVVRMIPTHFNPILILTLYGNRLPTNIEIRLKFLPLVLILNASYQLQTT